jgi:hypothetical protein
MRGARARELGNGCVSSVDTDPTTMPPLFADKAEYSGKAKRRRVNQYYKADLRTPVKDQARVIVDGESVTCTQRKVTELVDFE